MAAERNYTTTEKELLSIVFAVGTVSYTHLDVYKRQHTHKIDPSKVDTVAKNKTDSPPSGSL